MSSARTRVLVSHLGSNGGGPKFHYQFFFALLGRVDVTPHYAISGFADNESEFTATNSPHITIPTYRSRLGLVFGLPRLVFSAIRLRSYIKRHSISVVINSMESIYQGLIAPFGIPKGVKYVSCVHDATDHPGDEHFLKRLARKGERRRANEFVVFSHTVRLALEAQPFVGDRPIRETVHGTFGSGLPLRESRDLRVRPDEVVRVGFVGRLGRYKGLETLAEAIRILKVRGLGVEGWVYGSGPESSLASTQLGSSLNWNIGWIEDEEIPEILDSFDILALPYKEASQSGVVAYAMSRGIPMVATPVGGLVEQIETASCGVIASSHSADDFADALQELVTSPSRRHALGQNALEASRTIYSWKRVGDDVASWLAQ